MSRREKTIRLYVVGVAFVAAIAVLWGRLVQVQYVRHHYYSEVAQKQRVQPHKIPPTRGGIFDRAGRPLALNARLCSVGVTPSKVRSRFDASAAIARELPMSRAQVVDRIQGAKSFVYVARQCELTDEQRRRLADVDGVSVTQEAGRLYPYDGVASKLVGFVGYDNDGRSGIEIACEGELRGVPGLERVIRNGRYKTERYHRIVEKQPVNGKHVYLTIDARVQEIAEDELARAIEEAGARSGAVIVMDVATGEILALAESPSAPTRSPESRADSLWTIRSLSHVYEPGSTFKIVTAAALLEAGGVDPGDRFDAEHGRAKLGSAVINDPHPHDVISFEEAFAYSSNIVMAKASRLIPAKDFYEYIRLFGFGSRTGVRLNGESAGSVTEVASWSGRTQSTMAFGQEIAVTPLQMLDAYAAIANDGVMMAPHLIRGVADEATGAVTRFKPVEVRRVVSKETARTLRRFCRDVVEFGTGQAASVDFITVSGKTGTGQKASAHGGYHSGKFVSSFVGFAPHDNPRIACLVLIDEPRWAARYGGDSAAPVFARVCRGIANSTEIFDGALAGEVVQAPNRSRARFLTPNFMRMERGAALERARRLGANVLCQGDDGRVVAQDPAPDVPMDKDAVIRLMVAVGGSDKGERRIPDLRGLTMREAKRRAASQGFVARFVGNGVVNRQVPLPGRDSGFEMVKLYCDGSAGGGGGAP